MQYLSSPEPSSVASPGVSVRSPRCQVTSESRGRGWDSNMTCTQ